jgi:hypothetical protein
MNARFVVIVAVAVVMAAVPAVAQMSDADSLQQLRTDIDADRQALVAANLGLSDAESTAFWPIYRDYRADMQKIGDRMQKLILDFSEVWDAATEEQAKAMVNEMLSIQQAEVKVRKKHLSKFRKVLPEVKVARFLQIENKIDAVIDIGLADSIPLITSGG